MHIYQKVKLIYAFGVIYVQTKVHIQSHAETQFEMAIGLISIKYIRDFYETLIHFSLYQTLYKFQKHQHFMSKTEQICSLK